MFKLILFFTFIANKLFANKVDLSKTEQAIGGLTTALTGQLFIGIGTLAIVVCGYLYFWKPEVAKDKLIQVIIGSSIILAAGAIMAVFG